MAFLDILKFVAALGLVLSLIGGCAWLVNRLNLISNFARRTQAPRLSVRETLILDAKHRMMIVADDTREHVLLFGPSGDLVIESRPTEATGVTPSVSDRASALAEAGSQTMDNQTIVAMVKEAGQ
jgi:flagellar protein FliO/FliZ